MPDADAPHVTSTPPLPETPQQQLAALRSELRDALHALGMEVRGLLAFMARDAAGLVLLPVRVVFGLPLVMGTCWGLWLALGQVFG